MIDKKLAAYLYGYGFKLVDKEGFSSYIQGIKSTVTGVKIDIKYNAFWNTITIDQIGKDYFILAQDMSMLTQNIEGVGVALIELAKLSMQNHNWELENTKFVISKEYTLRFGYETPENDFSCFNLNGSYHVSNQTALFDKLDEMHFSHRLPPGTWKPIDETKI